MLLTVDQVRTKLLEMGVNQRILDNLEDPIQLRALYSHERMHALIQQRLISNKAIDVANEEFSQGEHNTKTESGLSAEHCYEILLGICSDS